MSCRHGGLGREGLRAFILFAALQAAGCTLDAGAKLDADSKHEPLTAQPDASCTAAQFGGHDYWVCVDDKKWQEAQAICASVSMHLVRIDDVGENAFVQSRVQRDAWIGARDLAVEGQWRWVDNDDLFWTGQGNGQPAAGAYNNWLWGQPNDALGQDCGELLDATGRWGDQNCNYERVFVCESSALTAAEPQAPGTACRRSEHAGSVYWECANQLSWEAARSSCQGIGTDLAALETVEEATYVKSLLRTDSHIGLTDSEAEGSWRWAHDGALSWCGGEDGRAPAPAFASWKRSLLDKYPKTNANCHHAERNGRGYWYCEDQRSWTSARSACEREGMSLARVDDAGEGTFIAAQIDHDTWLGGSDEGHEGQWVWIDGETVFWSGGAAVGGRYTNWVLSAPNSGSLGNCLLMKDGSARWDDEPCSYSKSWVCEAPAELETHLPDTLDCTVMESSLGRWRNVTCQTAAGYVCESVPEGSSASLDELSHFIREDVRSGQLSVGHVELLEDSQLTDLFLRADRRLGARECQDTFEPVGDPYPAPGLGLEVVEYAQHYHGIPVFGRGYTAHRDPASGAIRLINGRTDFDIELDTDPDLSELQAFVAGASALGLNPYGYTPRPEGTLAIVSATTGAETDWRLAWRFTIPPRGDDTGYGIAVDATNGALLVQSPWKRSQCSSLDVQTASGLTPDALTVNSSIDTQDPNNPFNPYVPLVADHNVASVMKLPGTPCADCGGSCMGTTCRCPDMTSCQPNPVALYSAAVSGERPRMFAQCEGQRFPRVAAVESLEVDVQDNFTDPNDPDSFDHRYAAAVYTAAERCLEFLNSRDRDGVAIFESATGAPWVGYDGLGAINVDLRLDGRGSIFGTHFDPLDFSVNFNPDDLEFPGISIELACHEIAHGVWAAIEAARCTAGDVDCNNDAFASDAETDSLNEALGDVFGNAAEMRVRGYPGTRGPDPAGIPGGFCFAGDPADNLRCIHDFADPEASGRFVLDPLSEGSCPEIQNAVGDTLYNKCPADYAGQNWCRFSNNCVRGQDPRVNCCEEHSNGTVATHWFYLVTAGGAGTNQASCDYTVESFDDDLEVATHQALRVVFTALKEHLFARNTGFKGFADATVTAARLLFGENSRQFRSTVNAWFAVNVREQTAEGGLAPQVFPQRNAQRIKPWIRFLWPADPAEPTWEHRIAIDQPGFFDYITTTSERLRPGSGIATTSLALPSNDSHRYMWQARPVGGPPWSCLPIHWFDGTTDEDRIETAGPINPLPDGKVRAGNVSISFNTIPTATEYRVQLGTTSQTCTATPSGDGRENVVQADDLANQVTFFSDVKPSETYYFSVQATGPNSLTFAFPDPVLGAPDTSNCFIGSFETAPMREPEPLMPLDGDIFSYHAPYNRITQGGPLEFRWTGFDNPDFYELRVYPRDPDSGECLITEFTPIDVPNPCGATVCTVTATDVPISNGEGYCWDVAAKLDSGASSQPTPLQRFKYLMTFPRNRVPGEQVGIVEQDPSTPISLAVDSYDKPVQFSWDPVDGAEDYFVKVGRWPWRYPAATIEPSNCQPGYCLDGPPDVPEPGRAIGPDTSAMIDAAHAGRGRYCWGVYPLIEGLAQPYVTDIVNCYTTGPAPPVVEITSPLVPPEDGFSSAPITATVTYPFVPSGNHALSVEPADTAEWQITATSPECAVEVTSDPFAWEPGMAWIFPDLYNCSYDLELTPQEGQIYTIRASATGELGEQSVDEMLEFGVCGGSGEHCCEGDECDSDELNCEDNTCVGCGSSGEVCCDTGAPCENDRLNCAGSTCVSCGGEGRACCQSGANCSSNLTCTAGTCECGARGQPCCGGSSCDSGSDTCENGSCRQRRVELEFTADGFCGATAVTVTNTGNVSSNAFNIAVAVSGGTVACPPGSYPTDLNFPCPGLAPGESCTQPPVGGFGPFCLAANGSWNIQVDSANQVAETDENNNDGAVICINGVWVLQR